MKIVCGLVFFLSFISAWGFTAQDADLAFHAFNTSFYSATNGFAHYQADTSGGYTAFWTQAEQIEMIEDNWERTGSADSRRMITESIAGFTNHFGASWTNNKFNDDLMWMTIACARGYQITTNQTFRDLAKKHFRAVYHRAWDEKLGGGLWWSTDRDGKNACVNGPAAIAACLLFQITGDRAYLNRAQKIYAWERQSLFNPTNGAVSDHLSASGALARKVFTYNQGTFIGAANLLWKLTGDTNYFYDALLAANFTKNNLCRDGLLPDYGSGDAAGFNGILIRWLARFVNDNHLQAQFSDWMVANADAAWNVRRTDNLSWQKWNEPTPAGILDSWNCSGTVVILQVAPSEPPPKNH